MGQLDQGQTMWIRRIVAQMRSMDAKQLREMYYIVAGYLAVSRAGAKKREDGGGSGGETWAQ